MTPEELIVLDLSVPVEWSVMNETLTLDSPQAIPRPPICASTSSSMFVTVMFHLNYSLSNLPARLVHRVDDVGPTRESCRSDLADMGSQVCCRAWTGLSLSLSASVCLSLSLSLYFNPSVFSLYHKT